MPLPLRIPKGKCYQHILTGCFGIILDKSEARPAGLSFMMNPNPSNQAIQQFNDLS